MSDFLSLHLSRSGLRFDGGGREMITDISGPFVIDPLKASETHLAPPASQPCRVYEATHAGDVDPKDPQSPAMKIFCRQLQVSFHLPVILEGCSYSPLRPGAPSRETYEKLQKLVPACNTISRAGI